MAQKFMFNKPFNITGISYFLIKSIIILFFHDSLEKPFGAKISLDINKLNLGNCFNSLALPHPLLTFLTSDFTRPVRRLIKC